jgi:hypothetical protein
LQLTETALSSYGGRIRVFLARVPQLKFSVMRREAQGGNMEEYDVKSVIEEDRKLTLLKAVYDLLKKCDDGAECDGCCLMEDIEYVLEEAGVIQSK